MFFLKVIMKALLPTLRENNRYIKFEINSKNRLDSEEIKKQLKMEIIKTLGQIELAKSSFKIINLKNNKGIIKVNSKYLDKTKACLTLINKLNKENIKLNSLKVSGLINKVNKGG